MAALGLALHCEDRTTDTTSSVNTEGGLSFARRLLIGGC